MPSDTELARTLGFDTGPERPFWPRLLITVGLLAMVALAAYSFLRPVVR
jgi:hypothetical protein